MHNFDSFNSAATMTVAFNAGKMWLQMIVICGTCGMIDYGLKGADYIFSESLKNQLMKLVKERGTLTNVIDLPKNIQDLLKPDMKQIDPAMIKVSIKCKEGEMLELDKIDGLPIQVEKNESERDKPVIVNEKNINGVNE